MAMANEGDLKGCTLNSIFTKLLTHLYVGCEIKGVRVFSI